MSAAPPLLLNLQGARRRLLYVTLFEGLAIAIVTLALLVFTGAGAASAGGLAIGSSAIALGWLLGLPPSVLLSLAPKAITAPVAMGIAQSIHGIPELAAIFVLTTGLIGAILGSYVFRLMGEQYWPVQGFALGTQAHGFGTARALQVNAEGGAYAGLALGLQALLGSLLIPLLTTLFR